MEDSKTRTSISLRIYRMLLALYPDEYIHRHGQELLQNFQDLERDSSSTMALWAFMSRDLITSLIYQHMPPRHWRLALFAFITYLPFLALFLIATSGAYFGETPLLKSTMAALEAHMKIGLLVIVALPAIGALAIIAALIAEMRDRYRSQTLRISFIRDNFLILGLTILGLGIVSFLPMHDLVPCVFHLTLKDGAAHAWQAFQFCRINS